jgi:hypothetical protein
LNIFKRIEDLTPDTQNCGLLIITLFSCQAFSDRQSIFF